MAVNSTRPFKNHSNTIAIVTLILQGIREVIPPDTPDHFRSTIENCWHQDPIVRPEACSMVTTDAAPIERANCAGIQLSATWIFNTFMALDRKRNKLESNGIPTAALNPTTSITPMDPCNMPIISSPSDIDIQDRHTKATSGDMRAQYALGMMYLTSDGDIHNEAMARHWLHKSAEQGHVQAQFHVGQSFEHGLFSVVDKEQAVRWYTRAAAQGLVQAKIHLETMVRQKHLTSYPAAARPIKSPAENLLDKIESLQKNLKFCLGSFALLIGQWKVIAGLLPDKKEFFILLQQAYVLAFKLSISRMALLATNSAQHLIQKFKEEISMLVEEEVGYTALKQARDKMKIVLHRSSTQNMFGDYRFDHNDSCKFFIPATHLLLLNYGPIAEDECTENFEGEFVDGPNMGERVHVKYYDWVNPGGPGEIIRIHYLTYLMRMYDNLVHPRFVASTSYLVVVEPITQQTLEKVRQEEELTNAQKIEVALTITGALAFVHSFDVVHCDVRASNVIMATATQECDSELPTTLWVPKLGGFGICQIVDLDYRMSFRSNGPVRLPELTSSQGCTFTTDTFAFGMLMYEISMGTRPATMKGRMATPEDVKDWQAQELGSLSISYSTLMQACMAWDPEARPTMEKVADSLASTMGELCHN